VYLKAPVQRHRRRGRQTKEKRAQEFPEAQGRGDGRTITCAYRQRE